MKLAHYVAIGLLWVLACVLSSVKDDDERVQVFMATLLILVVFLCAVGYRDCVPA